MSQIIRTRTAEIWIDEDDIVHTRFPDPNTNGAINDAIAHWEIWTQLFRHPKNLLLFDLKNLRSVTRESREFYKQEMISERVLAGAMIADSYFSLIIGNLFINFTRPPYPACLFTEEDAAIAWLKSVRDSEEN